MSKKILALIGVLVLVVAVALVIVLTRPKADDTAPAASTQPTEQATEEATMEPTAAPTEVPTAEPTAVPTAEPTAEPTAAPTAQATEPAATQVMAEATVEATPNPVDDFTVTLVNGETFTLSDYRGKVVVVDLWATWCPPCVASMPSLQSLSEEYDGRVVILGVNSGDSASTVRSFVEKNGYTFPIAIDEKMDILYNHFPTSGIPYTVFIDANGELFTTHMGGGDGVYDELKATIEATLEKTPVENE